MTHFLIGDPKYKERLKIAFDSKILSRLFSRGCISHLASYKLASFFSASNDKNSKAKLAARIDVISPDES